MASALPSAPIGVFDSGVGGLSVLRALHAELPQETLVYVADSGHAPYGERDDAHVIARSHALTDYLRAQHQIKALVVACNTATAAAIGQLRAAYPELPIVGIEPALKPAASHSGTGVVGVMATRGTLQSEKFGRLLQSLHGQASFTLQPCDGLAFAIECNDTDQVRSLCQAYLAAMGAFGRHSGAMDTLVLGCTHYPFVEAELRRQVGPDVDFLEGGAPVARQTRRLLALAGLLAPENGAASGAIEGFSFYTTGAAAAPLECALQRWLGWQAPVHRI